MPKAIKHHWNFDHSPEKVWEYLTRPELMELWLMKNNFKPVVGHEFQFNTGAHPEIQFDGIVHCKVLEIIPHKKLSYSWKCGPGQGRFPVDSVVVWTLKPTKQGTELLLEHGEFKEMENMTLYHMMNVGWLENMQKIAEQINDFTHGKTKA
jgi:uncharacterized protein YndB with AHSA1/START domain